MDGGYQPEHGGFEPGRVRGRPSRSKLKQSSNHFARCMKHDADTHTTIADMGYLKGNATDIGTTYVRYLENRRPKHQGVRGFEAERHSLSYVFDVCTFEMRFFYDARSLPLRCCHLPLEGVVRSIRFPLDIFIHRLTR